LLIAYLYHIAYQKGGLQKKGNLMAATITGYLSAAVLWIKSYLHLKADTFITPA
jgi:hypothetical protein